MSRKSTIELEQKGGQSKLQEKADFLLSSTTIGAAVIDAYKKNVQGDELSFEMALKVLESNSTSIKAGETEKIESMLMCQANALEVMFGYFARKALSQEYFNQYLANIQLALKVQNQCRKTLQALMHIKHPSQASFIKQTNISSGHQQINNNFISENPQNKLLETKVIHGSKKVD